MRSLVLAGAVCLLTSSCLDLFSVPFQAASIDHRFRFDAEADVLEWLEEQRGIVLNEEESEALDELVAVVRGKRVFPATGLRLDVDEMLEPDEERDDFETAIVELATTFRITGSEIVLDDDGRATLWRTGRIERAKEWLAAFQATVVADLQDEQAQQPDDDWPLPFELDAESWTLFRERARGSGIWRIDGRSFVIEAAMTKANADRCVAALVRKDVEAKYEDGVLTYRYRPGDGGWIPATFLVGPEPRKVEYASGIGAKLAGAGVSVGSAERWRELRAAAGLR